MFDAEDDDGPDYAADKAAASTWAHDLVTKGDFCVLDCETTGLPDRDPAVAIVQIAVVAGDGTVLLDTLVKPDLAIPAAATAIHRITAEMVAGAPTFPEIYPRLVALLDERTVLIYNRDFEWQVLGQCAERAGLEILSVLRWKCLMEKYAQWDGDWSDYHQSYTWKRLPGAGHTALEDCHAVLRLLHKMASQE